MKPQSHGQAGPLERRLPDPGPKGTPAKRRAGAGDEDLIRRRVANLIDNAVRHAPPGSIVRVELDQTGAGYAGVKRVEA